MQFKGERWQLFGDVMSGELAGQLMCCSGRRSDRGSITMTDHRKLLRAIFDAAVAAAHPDSILARICRARRKAASFASPPARAPPPWPPPRSGITSTPRARAARLTGVATTRHGHGVPTRRIQVIEAGHPVPDEAG